MSLLHSSKRRPDPLKPEDYDHEIDLTDHTRQTSPPHSFRSQSLGGVSTNNRPTSPDLLSESSSLRHSDVPLYKHVSLREELARRKYSKYQDPHLSDALDVDEQAQPDNSAPPDETDAGYTVEGDRGSRTGNEEPESAIDVLYENQRGAFLCCGAGVFSSSALGNIDPAPWTNIALKTSATNITNAQVPDPSWEWAWREWSVNHSDEVDENGWEYSFAFSKRFSWHGPSWWNSFVRRRAWIRKRVRKHAGYHVQQAPMLNEDYFTISGAESRKRSFTSTVGGSVRQSLQLSQRETEDTIDVKDVRDIGTLLKTLRLSRIDREKSEVVENFVKNGGDNLYYLSDHMHEIMGQFIFQASRQLLLTHLIKMLDEASAQKKADLEGSQQSNPDIERRLVNLQAAVKAADAEVKQLDFWSDVKAVAEKGETQCTVDGPQCPDREQIYLDDSGTKDVISKRDFSCADSSAADESVCEQVLSNSEKGKGKAKE